MEFINGFDKLEDIDNYSEEFQQSIIYKSIVKFDRESLISAIAKNEDINLRDNIYGVNYLHVLISHTTYDSQCHAVSMVYILSNAGICINETNFQNLTPIQEAINKNLVDIAIALIRCGAWWTDSDCDPANCQYSHEMNSVLSLFHPGLWNAVANNDYMSVSRLLSYWCRVRIQRGKQTLLLFARENNTQSLIIEALENSKSTMEYVHATLAGDEQRMLDILSNKNVDIYIKDMSSCSLYSSFCQSSNVNGHSLKWAALSMEHRHILYLLPEKKCRQKFTQISVDDSYMSENNVINCQKNKLARHSVAEFPPRDFQIDVHDSNLESAVCVLL